MAPLQVSQMGLDEVSTADHAHWIALAEDGSREAATLLMIDASICIRHGVPLPEPLAGNISEALYQAASIDVPGGADANTAFNLKRKPGANKYTNVYNSHLVCMEVQLAFLEGGSRASAYEAVTTRYNYGDARSVERRFLERKSDWRIDEQTPKELRTNIALYRELLKK
jgi:hypothetical protein